ncbi:MAG: V4R domain-containing protein [Promethearchaeota archaeon]
MEDQLQKLKSELRTGEGILQYQNQRHLMVSCPWFTALQTELENTIGAIGAASLIKNAAIAWGKQLLDIYTPQLKELTLKEKVSHIVETFNLEGWGLAELVELQETPPRIVIRKTHPYFDNTYKGSADEPRCYLYFGVMTIIAGFAESEKFRELEITETKCNAKGDSHCEFVVEPAQDD